MATEMERPADELQEVEEHEEFHVLDKLEAMGINKGDIKKAKDAGFFTAGSLLMHTTKQLAEIKGLSEAKISKMVESARNLCGKGFVTAREAQAIRERDIVQISTGCKAFDEMLGGGVETQIITEVFGEWRTGKTQLAHTMCVTAQLNSKNPGKVCYIDTEGSFRSDRIARIAERFNLEDPEAVLNNIITCQANTHEHLFSLLPELAAKMIEEPFKLVIIDSIISLFRTDFTGRGELAERQQKLNQFMSKLNKMAREFNVAVFITNQVMSDPSGGAMFVVDPKKPVGGHVMAHASHCRISLRKGKAEQRLAKIMQAPNRAEQEVSFAILDDGISDYKD